MTDSPEFLARRLREEGQKLAAYFSGFSPEQWQQELYGDEGWRARDLLAHFVSVEKGFFLLFGEIIKGGRGLPEDFSIDQYNRNQIRELAEIEPDDLLSMFIEARHAMVSWVAALSESALLITSRHPFLGNTTLAEMIKMVYRHNRLHLRDLRQVFSNLT